MKGTTNKELRLERVSINRWGCERKRFCGTEIEETCEVLAHVKGTAGTLVEYCFASMTLYKDGTEELTYLCPAVEVKHGLPLEVIVNNIMDSRYLIILDDERRIHWFLEK